VSRSEPGAPGSPERSWATWSPVPLVGTVVLLPPPLGARIAPSGGRLLPVLGPGPLFVELSPRERFAPSMAPSGPSATRWARSSEASRPRWVPRAWSTTSSVPLTPSRVRTLAPAGGATTNGPGTCLRRWPRWLTAWPRSRAKASTRCELCCRGHQDEKQRSALATTLPGGCDDNPPLAHRYFLLITNAYYGSLQEMSLSLMMVGMSPLPFCSCLARDIVAERAGPSRQRGVLVGPFVRRPPLKLVRELAGARPVPTLTRSAFSGRPHPRVQRSGGRNSPLRIGPTCRGNEPSFWFFSQVHFAR